MRWVTFHYDFPTKIISAFEVHENKETALKYFNSTIRNFFKLNTNFKVDKLPATYDYGFRKYCGMSARAFKKEFHTSVDEALEKAQRYSELRVIDFY